ncbi:RNA repair transcriptional activator RtcR family protein [Rhodobacteraceae bacterium PA1-206B]
MADPRDFQEVYGKLYDFAADYGFERTASAITSI